jgi:fibronectin-binding autotransporter adhesin
MRFATSRLAVCGAVATIALVFAVNANAGTYYWYGGGSGTLGGAGTWDTALSYWSASTDTPSYVAWPNTTDDGAYFGGAGGAVTVSGSVTAGGLAVAASDYNFSGGTLGLGGGGIATWYSSGTSAISSAVALRASQSWTVGAGAELNVSGVVSGTGMALTASGAGTLTFGATNTYTGGTTINAGATLQLAGALSTTGAIVDNGTLIFNGASAYACSNAISGTGSLYKWGANRLTISANNSSYSGNIYLSSGTLVASNATTTNKPLGTGLLTLSGGTLSSGNNNTRLYNPIYVTPGANTTVYAGSYDLRLDYVDATTTVTGSGTMTILTANSSRVIRLYADTRQSTGTFVVTGPAGILEIASFSGGNSTTWVLNGSGDTRITSTNTFTYDFGELSGTSTTASIYAANSNMFTLSVGSLNTDATFAGHLYDISGGTSGTLKMLAVTKVGTGTWTLSGTNAYSGSTNLNNGAVLLANASALGGSGTIGFGGGTLMLSAANTTDYSARFSTAANQAYSIDTNGQSVTLATPLTSSGGSLTKAGEGTLTLAADSTYSGNTTVNAGVLQIGAGSAVGAVAGNIDVAASATVTFNRSNAYSYSGAISGSGSVAVTGGGTLTLSGTHTYTGATTVSAGSLRVSGTIAAGGSVSVASGASLALTGGSVGSVSLDGGATLAGYGSASSVYVAVNGVIGSSTDNSTWGRTLAITNLTLGDLIAYVNVGSVSAYTASAAVNVSGTADLTACMSVHIGLYGPAPTGKGTATLIRYSGSLSGSPSYFIDTVSFANNRFSCTYGTVASGSVISVNLNYTSDNPYWTGSGNRIWSTATQSPKNWSLVYAGTATDYIGGDVVLFDNRVASSAATVTLGESVNPANVTFNNSSTVSYTITDGGSGYAITGATSLTKNGAGTVTLLTNNDYSGGTTINAGALQLGNGGASGSIVGNVVNDGALAFKRSDAYEFAYVISGTGSVSQLGSGTLTLSADNTYTGDTTLRGTLQLGNGGMAGGVSGNIVNNGSLVFNRSDASTYGGVISGTGSVAHAGSGTLTLTGESTCSGTTTISAGVLRIGGGSSTGSLGGDVVNNTALVFNRSDDCSFSHAISGTGSVAQAGSGTLTLSGANTYSGGTNLLGGTLLLGSSGAIGTDGTVSFSGGTLAFSAANTIDYSGRFSAADNQAYNISTPSGQTVALAGNLTSSGGSLTKLGDGTLTLSGSNTYTGGTHIKAGVLLLESADALGTSGIVSFGYSPFGSGTLTFSSGNTVDYSARLDATTTYQAFSIDTNGQSVTFASALNGSGSYLKKFGAGTLTLTGNTTFIGASTCIYDGTLQIGNGGTAGSFANNIADNGALVFNRSNANAYTYAISGTGSVAQVGSGTLTLSGTNTYSGATTLSAGCLVASGATNTTPLGTGTLILSGGTLSSGNDNTVLPNAVSVAPDANTVIYAGAYNLRLTGTVTGSGTATVSVVKTVRLHSDNSALVGTIVLAGTGTCELGSNAGGNSTTWILNGDTKLGTSVGPGGTGNIALGELSGSNAGASLYAVNGASSVTYTIGAKNTDSTYAGHIYDSAGGSHTATTAVTKVGTGALTLSGANSYTGPTTVNGGMLVIQGDAATAAIFAGVADIGAGKLVFDYAAGGSATGATISDQVQSILAASYNGGTNSWASGAIHSTLANSHSTDSYALGWSNNTATSAVTVKVVLYGDATMDGTVNIYDLGQVLANYNKSGVWDTGDFNYDGTVNIYDLGTVLANYNKSISLSEVSVNPADYSALDGQALAALGAAGVNVVPEPGTLALLAAGAIGLLAYARRRRK